MICLIHVSVVFEVFCLFCFLRNSTYTCLSQQIGCYVSRFGTKGRCVEASW